MGKQVMMLKLAGAVLVIGSGSMIGYCKSREYRARIKDLEMLKTIICLMRGEMMYSMLPLKDICAKLGRKTNPPYCQWMKKLEKELECKGEKMLAEIWKKATEEKLNRLSLKKEEKEELMELGAQIGSVDLNTQEKILQWYSLRLEEYRRKGEEEIKENTRICNCLGVAAGIVITILLV